MKAPGAKMEAREANLKPPRAKLEALRAKLVKNFVLKAPENADYIFTSFKNF